MLPIQTILHPTDFSERSGHALRLAYALARDHGARLVLLHVAPAPVAPLEAGVAMPDPEGYLMGLKQQLDRLALPGADVPAERRLEEGDAAARILQVAQETHPDLIVMGTHGRTGLARLLMGSVAEQVVRRAPCPVLTMKMPFPAEAAPAVAEVEEAKSPQPVPAGMAG